MARDVIREIIELKSRNEFTSTHQYQIRLYSLERMLESIDETSLSGKEALRYIPIAIVACIEGHFRSLYAEIIDFGEPFSKNVENFNKSNIKFNYNIIDAIQNKRLTIGEFISHTLPCNNINDIDHNISILLEVKFLKSLNSFENKSIFEDQRLVSKNFIKNKDEVIKNIIKVFELRHIFCHEFGSNIEISKCEIEKLVNSTRLFIEQATDFINFKLYPDAPETQTDMNIHAHEEFNKVNKKFERHVKLIKSQNFSDILDFDQDLFDKSILKWKEYRESEAKFKSSVVEGGSMQPMIYSMTMTEATLRKIKELEEDFSDLF